METIPRLAFARILKYATENGQMLKIVFHWKKVSKLFAKKLETDFWPDIEDITIRFFSYYFKPFPMRIGSENYESIDMRPLMNLKLNGIPRSVIVFADATDKDFVLPQDFAISVPFPASILLGNYQNLNDPELLRILCCYRDYIEDFHFFITNPTINETFMDALLNIRSLKCLTLPSNVVHGTPSVEIRKMLFMRLLSRFSLKCLILTSVGRPGCQCIFDFELFAMLESQRVSCLHLISLSHYIERWIATEALHNRAQITNLCISNDQFQYNGAESENNTAPLFHTISSYRLLFPKLQYLCIGIPCIHIDDSQLEHMLLSYFDNPFRIKVRLTVRIWHNLLEVPIKKFDWLLNKLKSLNAAINLFHESNTDGRITISSQTYNIFYELSIRFATQPLDKGDFVYTDKLLRCADSIHHRRGAPTGCLCASNNN